MVCPLMTQADIRAALVTELRNDINSNRASAQLKNALARDLAEVPFQLR